MSSPALAHDASRIVSAPVYRPVEPRERQPMSLSDQERWARVQARLRAVVGEENFRSWFGAMEHDAINGTVRDDAFKTLVSALQATGCRPGEVAAVTAEMVNLEVGTWTFRRHKTVKKTGKPRPPLALACCFLILRIYFDVVTKFLVGNDQTFG